MTDALFAVDANARRIRGLLIPYGELSAPNISGTDPVMFSQGTVELPADPSIVTLNEGHDQLEPRGRAVELTDTPEGVVAEFEVARTPEGDALLARAQETPRPRLSAELRGLVRRGQDAVSAALRGAAVVPAGAFQSAALFAALDTVTTEPDTTQTTETAPAVTDNPEDSESEDNPKEADMADAVVPGTLTAPGTPDNKDTTTADGLFAAVALARTNPEAVAPYRGGDALFAISTLQHSGPSTVTIGADVQVPNYVGELWTRRAYERRFVPLLNHGTLTSYKVVGWKWDYANSKAPVVGDYSGNTAEIPSNDLDTIQVTADAARIAGGHKIDRRYLDFNDQGVIASYFRNMTEDVARKTDGKALAAIIAAATAKDVSSIVVNTDTSLAIQGIVDGALGVIATENRPTFALVDPSLYRDLMFTPRNDVLGYLNAGFGLEEGSLEGFKILPAAVGTGKVIVGAKEAITFYELGGLAPIRVEGIDPHHGAFDPAVFAYYATLTHNAAAIVEVDTADYDDGDAGEE